MLARLLPALVLPALAAAAFADGNVTVSVDPVTHDLVVTGDGLPNDIEITDGGPGGAFLVTGRNGTSVNAGVSASVTGARSFKLDMGAGNDVVNLTGTSINGGVRAALGEGNDALTIDGGRFRGRVGVRGDFGNDAVIVRGGAVLLSTFVFTGGEGNDDAQLLDAVFKQRVKLALNEGDNTILLQGASFERAALVQVKTGDGADRLEVDHCSVDNDLKAALGGGDDDAIVSESNFSQDCAVNGGGGGGDDLSLRDGNNFEHRPSFRSFEE